MEAEERQQLQEPKAPHLEQQQVPQAPHSERQPNSQKSRGLPLVLAQEPQPLRLPNFVLAPRQEPEQASSSCIRSKSAQRIELSLIQMPGIFHASNFLR